MARALPLLAITAVMALMGLAATAQTHVLHLLECDARIDGLAAKQATEAVKALDAAAMLSWHERSLKVRLSSAVSAAQLLEALNAGERRYTFNESDPRQGMPLHRDTGDPAGDDLRYQQAKAAWLHGQSGADRPMNPEQR